MRERLAPRGALVTGFGHLGDANLHLNICTPQERTLPPSHHATAPSAALF